ncbi:hypothetical protein AVEN_22076-1 [Araneus ventricosus]|uniref:Uncharacterized protein n=1 Tax=Araneus ventricosus TaxID=182803 RepID=A0A4Y2GWC0_ARAVE|nr:hypothetical protein AVEN_22076-1 [Araneus ventricosus]
MGIRQQYEVKFFDDYNVVFLCILPMPKWSRDKISASGTEGSQLETRRFTEVPLYMRACLSLNQTLWVKCHGVVWKFGMGEEDQVSSAPSDRGTKL